MRRILMVTLVMVTSGTGNVLANEQQVMKPHGELSQQALAEVGLGNLDVMSDQQGLQLRVTGIATHSCWEAAGSVERDWLNNQVVRTFPEKVFRLPPLLLFLP